MFKKLLHTIVLVAATMMTLSSCQKEETVQNVQLEVNANNISGKWELVSINGRELLEGTYLHIEFTRNDRTYVITDGIQGNPNAPKTFDGRYDFEYDDALGTILVGLYNHDTGLWNDSYIVTLEPSIMTLESQHTGEVQTFRKIVD